MVPLDVSFCVFQLLLLQAAMMAAAWTQLRTVPILSTTS